MNMIFGQNNGNDETSKFTQQLISHNRVNFFAMQEMMLQMLMPGLTKSAGSGDFLNDAMNTGGVTSSNLAEQLQATN